MPEHARQTEFDPYHKWLGIPSWEQPPNHYRLLGLTNFESDPDAIESAADQRMAHVRTFQSSVHSAQSQRLLNELAAAKLCLLSAERKYAYDTQLMAKQRSPLSPPQAKWPVVVPKAVDPAPVAIAPPAKRLRPKIKLPEAAPTQSDAHVTLLFAAGIVGVLVAGFVFYKTRDHSPSQVTPDQSASANQLVKDDAEKARSIEARAAKDGGSSSIPSSSDPVSTAVDDFFADDGKAAPPKSTSDDLADFFADGNAPAPAIAPFDAAQAKAHQHQWAEYLKLPVEYTNSIGMRFMLIPPGEFLMGSTQEEVERALREGESTNAHWQKCVKSEAPAHKVSLTRPFYIAVREVTQKEYQAVIGKNPSYFAKTGPDGKLAEQVGGIDTTRHPVEGVSWNDAAEFCAKLSQLEGLKPFYSRAGETVTALAGTGYRLATEAEWEFACRAGTTTKFWCGDTEQQLMPAAWFGSNSGRRTHEVEQRSTNPFGLFDVHGNVWEFVEDGWQPSYPERSTGMRAVKAGEPFSGDRVARGGNFAHYALGCRSSHRAPGPPTYPDRHTGFRVAMMAEVSSVGQGEEPRGSDPAIGTMKDDSNVDEFFASDSGAPTAPDDFFSDDAKSKAPTELQPSPGPSNTGGIDLLRLVDLKRDAVRGNWRAVGNGALQVTSSDGGKADALLSIRYRPKGGYVLRVTASRERYGGIALPVLCSGKQFEAYLSGGWKGSSIPVGAHQHKVDFFPTTSKVQIVCTVRPEGVSITNGDSASLEWSDWRSVHGTGWRPPGVVDGMLWLNVWETYTIHEMTLVPER